MSDRSDRTEAAEDDPLARMERDLPDAPLVAASVYETVARLARQLRSAKLPSGLTIERLSTLGSITARAPITLSELAVLESVSIGAMSRSVAALEEQGFVKRKQHADDGRTFSLFATAKGTAAFTSALQRYVSHLVSIMSDLNAEQRTAIRRLLATDRDGH